MDKQTNKETNSNFIYIDGTIYTGPVDQMNVPHEQLKKKELTK